MGEGSGVLTKTGRWETHVCTLYTHARNLSCLLAGICVYTGTCTQTNKQKERQRTDVDKGTNE